MRMAIISTDGAYYSHGSDLTLMKKVSPSALNT